MFGSATLSLLVLLLLVSLLARQAPLFLLALALLLASGLSRIWERFCLTGLEYGRTFSRQRVPFGESVDLEIEIVNRKLLPLSWLEIEEQIPRELPPTRGELLGSHLTGRAILRSLIAMRPYERVRRRYRLPCNARGEHSFGPVRLRTGDLFGLISREVDLEPVDLLVVYPRVAPLAELGLPAHQPLGDIRARSWLFEDPSRVAGIREHRPEDGLRRIHWAASARSQRLQVKVFEPTTNHKLAIFLNVNTTDADWWDFRYDPDALELAITTAASIASWGLAEGFQVGLMTNGTQRLRSHSVAVDATSDPAQLPAILEALARLQAYAARPFAQTLSQGARRLAYGSTVVVVTAQLVATDVAQLIAMRRRGHPVVVIMTGRQEAPGSLAGVVVRRVGPPEAWRTAAVLAMGV